VDQFESAVIAILDGLRGLALAAVQDGVGGVALVFGITATSTLSAVLVWLRASERISVTDLGRSGPYGSSQNDAVAEARAQIVSAPTVEEMRS